MNTNFDSEQKLVRERNRPKSNDELFAIVQVARTTKDFAGALNTLGVDDLRRIDKYFDQDTGAHNQNAPDHELWKQVRAEILERFK